MQDLEPNNAAGTEPNLTDTGSAGAVEPPPAPAAPPPPTPEELQELRQKAAERDAFLDCLKREKADAINFRNRVRKDAELAKLYANQELVIALLPILDNLERVLEAASRAPVDAVNRPLVEGVELVRRQLVKVLEDQHVEALESLHVPFNPAEHEAVLQRPCAEHPRGIVLEVVQKGYRLRDRVVRPSRVIVSSGPPEAADGPNVDQQGEQTDRSGEPGHADV